MANPSSRRRAQSWPYKRYKEFEQELRTAAEKWFKSQKATIHPKMKYCLKSHSDWRKNIICKKVAIYIQDQCAEKRGKDSFPLHKYLHHGLSSQAMIFNLIGPLITANDFEPLKKVIEKAKLAWPAGEIDTDFEYDDRDVFNEDTGQPTSIDLAINKKIFIEAKLAEREFGGCSIFAAGDCDGRNPIHYGKESCYLSYIGRKYWCQVKEFGLDKMELFKGQICPLACYYQFYREVLFALSKKGTFVLLHDERNPAFLKSDKNNNVAGLWDFLIDSVPSEHKNKIARITIQEVAAEIENSGRHNDWIYEFKSKYGLGNN